MKKHPHVGVRAQAGAKSSPFGMATMAVELAFYSWETMARRGLMMANGTCSPAEYRRMVMEKATAFGTAALKISSGRPDAFERSVALLHATTKANALRLRK